MGWHSRIETEEKELQYTKSAYVRITENRTTIGS